MHNLLLVQNISHSKYFQNTAYPTDFTVHWGVEAFKPSTQESEENAGYLILVLRGDL